MLRPLSETAILYKFKGKTLPTLMCSDIHLDSIHCKRDLLKEHFDEIKKAGGIICIYGDLLDVMASYGDKRIKREYVDPLFIKPGVSYLDSVIDYTVQFLEPYRENIKLITYGNHEQTIRKFHDTDPLRRIKYRLVQGHDVEIGLGYYSGWFIIEGQRGRNEVRNYIHYHHGFGGNAKRSKGMLDVQIEAMRYPDADILIRGHTHQKWYDPSTTRQRITRAGRIYKDKVKYIQSGSYVDTVADGKGGWVVEKNFTPTDLGGWFVDFTVDRKEFDGADKSFLRSTVVETPVHEF
jgi:UDP-2,3-diacylglucosamine pyrophosphatase LpxH